MNVRPRTSLKRGTALSMLGAYVASLAAAPAALATVPGATGAIALEARFRLRVGANARASVLEPRRAGVELARR